MFDDSGLVGGEHFAHHLINSDGSSNGFGRALVVPREHHHTEPRRLKGADSLSAVAFDRIGAGYDPYRHVVFADDESRLARFGQSFEFLEDSDVVLCERTVANGVVFAIDLCKNAARLLAEVLRCIKSRFVSTCASDDRLSQGMLAFYFNGSRKFQKVAFTQVRSKYTHVSHNRFAFCHGAGFIQNHGADSTALFKRFGRLKENAKTRRPSRTHHHGRGCCESQGARARNHKNAHSKRHGKFNICAHGNPDKGCHKRNRKHHGHENAADAIGKTSYRRLGGSRFIDQSNHLRQRRVSPHARGFGVNVTGMHERCGRNLAAHPFFDRQTFSG